MTNWIHSDKWKPEDLSGKTVQFCIAASLGTQTLIQLGMGCLEARAGIVGMAVEIDFTSLANPSGKPGRIALDQLHLNALEEHPHPEESDFLLLVGLEEPGIEARVSGWLREERLTDHLHQR